MKKSELYQIAMIAVVNSNFLNAGEKLEVLERLMEDKTMAGWSEKKEAERA